ncbi:hypothetical protein FB45DRAFT_1039094 [Roridomyces roridus]|uniref:Uncharacterized protein n=1 Tax=Roridomyces roridus TaxID=1738132 RepID=A0AAD7B3U7_9AGAR|nr:hypothetical protein FB45DRAFT_1039094 [Roridomyces roridus]
MISPNTVDGPLLSADDLAVVYQLHRNIAAAAIDDPEEQALFLDACVKSVLLFREYKLSFALYPPTGSILFTLATLMEQNQHRRSAQPSPAYLDLMAFIDEIVVLRNNHWSCAEADRLIAASMTRSSLPDPLVQAPLAPNVKAESEMDPAEVFIQAAISGPPPSPAATLVGDPLTVRSPDTLSPLSTLDGLLVSLSLQDQDDTSCHHVRPLRRPRSLPLSIDTRKAAAASPVATYKISQDRPPTPFPHFARCAQPHSTRPRRLATVAEEDVDLPTIPSGSVILNYTTDSNTSSVGSTNWIVPKRALSRHHRARKHKLCFRCMRPNHVAAACPLRFRYP